MTKTELRKAVKARRDAHFASLTVAERCAFAILLADRVLTELGDAATVAAYLPIGSEIDTLPLIDRLVARGTIVALPHVGGFRGTMRLLEWAPGDSLPAGPMGLRQPEADAREVLPDVILTPLLAFDDDLGRLGYGAGFYDRAFASMPNARRIGLAWDAQHCDVVPTDDWDVALHAIATEHRWVGR